MPTQRRLVFEVYVYRHAQCVHVYAPVWSGQFFYRSLVCSSKRAASLRTFKADAEFAEVPQPKRHTVVFDRVPHDAADGPATRQLLPQECLHGLLPEAILDAYNIFQSTADRLVLAGEPKDAKKDGQRSARPALRGRLHERAGDARGGRAVAAELSRTAASGEAQHLVNLLNAAPDTDLCRLSAALIAVQDVSQVLVWAAFPGAPEGGCGVVAVELPKLGLAFDRQMAWGQSRLVCAAYPDWYLATDRQPLHKAMQRRAAQLPNSLLLASVQGGRVAVLAVAAMPEAGAEPGEVSFRHDDEDWNAAVSKCFLYEVLFALPELPFSSSKMCFCISWVAFCISKMFQKTFLHFLDCLFAFPKCSKRRFCISWVAFCISTMRFCISCIARFAFPKCSKGRFCISWIALLHFQNALLHFQKAFLHFQNALLHFQKAFLHFQNAFLHFLTCIFAFPKFPFCISKMSSCISGMPFCRSTRPAAS